MKRAYISFGLGAAAFAYALLLYGEGRSAAVVALAAFAGVLSVLTGYIRWRIAR